MLKLLVIFSIFISTAVLTKQREIRLSDDQIKHLLIQQSISAYPGNCPCPYHVDRAGKHCGKRSAGSRPGGHSPLCFPRDVTPQMIDSYRNRLES